MPSYKVARSEADAFIQRKQRASHVSILSPKHFRGACMDAVNAGKLTRSQEGQPSVSR